MSKIATDTFYAALTLGLKLLGVVPQDTSTVGVSVPVGQLNQHDEQGVFVVQALPLHADLGEGPGVGEPGDEPARQVAARVSELEARLEKTVLLLEKVARAVEGLAHEHGPFPPRQRADAHDERSPTETLQDQQRDKRGKAWLRPNDQGEAPGGLCCQRSAGRACGDHDPDNYCAVCWRPFDGLAVRVPTAEQRVGAPRHRHVPGAHACVEIQLP